AANLGYPALALTDHNGIYGAMAFAQEAKSLGLQAITGAELTLLDGSHVTILAETPEGYANLCRLITEAHLGRADRRDPRLEFAALEARHDGLIVLSGCTMCSSPAATALRSTARTARGDRTPNSPCDRSKKSRCCSVTVPMLSPLRASSPIAAARSISHETWATASPTSGAPTGRPPP